MFPDCIASFNFAGAWWEVDLGASYAIAKVEVHNRHDCCGERLSNSRVILKDGADPVANYAIGTALTDQVFNILAADFTEVPTITASRVRVQLNGNTYLQLTEIKVYDTNHNNIAAQGTPTQSSTYGSTYSASKAIDGATDSVSITQSEQGKNQNFVAQA